ncbi:carbohydrate ABC transporter permease [Catenuloplanes atrovinosus]|uniref:Multiple sugar transport system permease protein n=1 Tax=Catenuloplanes atrovinosus TaxID=137266 RepID=A0AAE4CC07_9ACTN|nr:carbohydrate ABC transporter permease [Catenuloplanes atrovinosus]MDR7277484.1 multiple sugar transport system permease protein [Catenuloplanes atrovinosus]
MRTRLPLSLLGVAVAILWLIPLAWAIDTSIKPEGETTRVPVTWIPDVFTLDAYRDVFTASDVPLWLLNSLVVATGVTVLTLAAASLAAYGFSRLDFPGKNWLFALILAGIMVPPQALIVPLFHQMQSLGLIDTYWGIILPQLAAPVIVFILKKFFDGLPREYEQAAALDGASRLRMFWSVVLPMSRPVLAAVGVFTFVGAWNNFLWPFIVISDPDLMTVPVGLGTVQSSYGLRYAEVMASAVIGGLPLVVVYAFLQRHVIRGVGDAGLKG